MRWCSREYRDTLAAAGLGPEVLEFDLDLSLRSRLLRRLLPRPYAYRPPARFAAEAATHARRLGAEVCFLNNTAALSLAPALRAAAPSLRLVFLSHGAELTDVVNNLRLTPETAPRDQRSAPWLGRLLLEELRLRSALDGAVVIAEPDVLVEEWLGTPAVAFLPRTVPAAALPLAPVPGRVGCVSTLDHGPNLQGIRLLVAALDPVSGVRLRLVGGPESLGRELASSHPTVDYLGPLDDPSLLAEAATWRAFVNPLFCPARGASTKVATALGWGLPVLTTPQGRRGYRWPEDALPLADTPESLAALACRVATAHDSELSHWRNLADHTARAAPDLPEAARLLHAFLSRLRS